MKYLIAALAATVLTLSAQAEPPPDVAARVAHMVAECRSVMARGVCIVQNREPLPESVRNTPMRLGYGLGTVPTGAFIDIQLAGPRMCDVIEQECKDWDSDHCKVIRSLWRQQ